MNKSGLDVTFAGIAVSDFVDAFSHETIARHNHIPRKVVSYSWDTLKSYREPNSGCVPSGIIMHTARVGSTLQVRLLRCIPNLAVYSEPPVFNDLLMPPIKCDLIDLLAALRLVGHLIGLHAGADFVLKLRSWNSLFAAAVTEAFPETPWVFAVRHPVEVGVSVQRRPPTWMRLRTASVNPFLSYAKEYGDVDTAETYFASMLAAFYGAATALRKEHGILVDYRQLPSAVLQTVCPHFCLKVVPSEVARMHAVSLHDAKCIVGEERPFLADTDEKRAAASPALKRAVDAIALPALRRLQLSFGRHSR